MASLRGLSKTAALGIVVVIVVVAAAVALLFIQQQAAPSPTPTPEASPSPTPPQTPSPTPSPTMSPSPTPTETPTTPAPEKLPRKICVVYDIGGRGDLSFNDMAYLGASRAAKDFGLEVIEVQSRSEADYLPNLRSLAKKGECLVIVAVGFLMTDAVKQVADEYPDQLFAIIDGYIPDKPNVLSVLFKEHEGSALVGALAAMTAAHYGCKAVGVVLGMEIPVLYKFEAGYYWGIRYGEMIYKKYTGQEVRLDVLWTYTGAFNDPPRGKTATEAMLRQGACVVYNVAGATGLGIFDAVYEEATKQGRDMGPPFAIGVDADQDWIKPGFILASMMKRVDVGVYTAVENALKYKRGEIDKYGGILELGLAEGGVGVSRLEDLETFLELGVQAGTVKPEEKEEIIAKVKKLRESIPSWIWEEVDKLAELLKTNKDIEVMGLKFSDIEKMIPLDSEEIKQIRQQLGVKT